MLNLNADVGADENITLDLRYIELITPITPELTQILQRDSLHAFTGRTSYPPRIRSPFSIPQWASARRPHELLP